MTSYVLVHGAWHGGWCWERLREQIAPHGAGVETPTLTGLGDRAAFLSPDLSLQTHIDDIVRLLEDQDLRKVVLVGHSYGGMVVTGVAARASQRLARLVYLDAVVPKDGQSLFDCSGPKFRSWIDEQVSTRGDGWRIPPAPPEFLGLSASADIDWVMPNLVPHPYRTFRDSVQLPAGWESALPRSYINCIGGKPRGGARSAQAEGIEDYYELPTGHDAMVTAPRELAELLRKFS